MKDWLTEWKHCVLLNNQDSEWLPVTEYRKGQCWVYAFAKDTKVGERALTTAWCGIIHRDFDHSVRWSEVENTVQPWWNAKLCTAGLKTGSMHAKKVGGPYRLYKNRTQGSLSTYQQLPVTYETSKTSLKANLMLILSQETSTTRHQKLC